MIKYTEYFKEQVGIIIKVIGEHGGELHQDDFDKEFRSFDRVDGKVIRNKNLFGWVPLSCMIGAMEGDISWSRWLELTQDMVREGIISIKGTTPDSVYFLIYGRYPQGTLYLFPTEEEATRFSKSRFSPDLRQSCDC